MFSTALTSRTSQASRAGEPFVYNAVDLVTQGAPFPHQLNPLGGPADWLVPPLDLEEFCRKYIQPAFAFGDGASSLKIGDRLMIRKPQRFHRDAFLLSTPRLLPAAPPAEADQSYRDLHRAATSSFEEYRAARNAMKTGVTITYHSADFPKQ